MALRQQYFSKSNLNSTKSSRTFRGTANRIGEWQAAISSSDGNVKGSGASASVGVVSGCGVGSLGGGSATAAVLRLDEHGGAAGRRGRPNSRQKNK
jgi:hypothetical protein